MHGRLIRNENKILVGENPPILIHLMVNIYFSCIKIRLHTEISFLCGLEVTENFKWQVVDQLVTLTAPTQVEVELS